MDHESSDDLSHNHDEEVGVQEAHCEENPPLTSFKLPQESPTTTKTKAEALIDYSQSHILTSTQHVATLEEIVTKKDKIQEEKEERERGKRKVERAYQV